ncbi:hypothetical protein P4133_34560 [Pseudomonas aeruginosa]|nr:hypothetical protein [Pseudomonas aeruginosa]
MAAEDIAAAIWASQIELPADTVTGEVLEGDLKAGDFVKLDRQFVSSVVLTDSATTPAGWSWVRIPYQISNGWLDRAAECHRQGPAVQNRDASEVATGYTMFTSPPPGTHPAGRHQHRESGTGDRDPVPLQVRPGR